MARTCAVERCTWDRTAPVHTWTVTGPTSTHEVDLCEVHQKGIDMIANLGRTVGTPRGRVEADVMDNLWDETRDA